MGRLRRVKLLTNARADISMGPIAPKVAWFQAMNATSALNGFGPIGRVMRAEVVGAGEGASG